MSLDTMMKMKKQEKEAEYEKKNKALIKMIEEAKDKQFVN